jgi:hypothetical protein
MQIWQFLTLEIWMRTFIDSSVKRHESLAPQVATA